MSSPPQAFGEVSNNAIVVRRARSADVEAVIELAKRIPTVAQWSGSDYESCCAAGQQAQTQVKALFIACAPAPHAVESVPGTVVGFAAFSAIPHAGGGECELENMAVAETWRGQGIGARLLAAGLLWCRAQSGSSLSLEVRAGNLIALAFYERAGFQANGRRLDYYKQPDDDAVLMWTSLDAQV